MRHPLLQPCPQQLSQASAPVPTPSRCVSTSLSGHCSGIPASRDIYHPKLFSTKVLFDEVAATNSYSHLSVLRNRDTSSKVPVPGTGIVRMLEGELLARS